MTAAVPPRSRFSPSRAPQGFQVVGENSWVAPVAAARDARAFSGAGAGDAQAVDELVGPAVVRAADLDDALVAGEGPRGPNRGHARPRCPSPSMRNISMCGM